MNFESKLAYIVKNNSAISKTEQAASLLHESGVLDLIRLLSIPNVVSADSPNFVAFSASEAHRCLGILQVLDLLINFREVALKYDARPQQAAPTYGGIENALLRDDLTKEEVDAIRENTPIPAIKPVAIGKSARTAG